MSLKKLSKKTVMAIVAAIAVLVIGIVVFVICSQPNANAKETVKMPYHITIGMSLEQIQSNMEKNGFKLIDSTDNFLKFEGSNIQGFNTNYTMVSLENSLPRLNYNYSFDDQSQYNLLYDSFVSKYGEPVKQDKLSDTGTMYYWTSKETTLIMVISNNFADLVFYSPAMPGIGEN